jgi:branched-chain amino acid transport system permease protein
MTILTILFDGIAYGMLLFVLASGLAVTMGLMNFVNLAHGAFAMAGGYICFITVNRWGLPFFAALPVAFAFSAAIGALLETTLYRRLYNRPHLDQVLFTGSTQVFIDIPEYLRGRINVFGVGMGKYRLLIIAICGIITIGVQLILSGTRFGARLRGSVDDSRVARGLGINVNRVFAVTFAFGSGLAGLGGALGAEMLGLDPAFPLKFLIYILIVVTVGGTTSITGPFFASLILGVADVAGKYYVPSLGAFVIYTMMIVMLLWRPHGLFSRGMGR